MGPTHCNAQRRSRWCYRARVPALRALDAPAGARGASSPQTPQDNRSKAAFWGPIRSAWSYPTTTARSRGLTQVRVDAFGVWSRCDKVLFILVVYFHVERVLVCGALFHAFIILVVNIHVVQSNCACARMCGRALFYAVASTVLAPSP